MASTLLAAIYIGIALWFAAGLLIALPFAFFGAHKILPSPAPLTPGARLAVVPGAIVFWPLVLKRWLAAKDAS